MTSNYQRVHYVRNNEAKCIFCTNWIYGSSLRAKQYNSCDSCVKGVLQKNPVLLTTKGEKFHIFLVKKDPNTQPQTKWLLNIEDHSQMDKQQLQQDRYSNQQRQFRSQFENIYRVGTKKQSINDLLDFPINQSHQSSFILKNELNTNKSCCFFPSSVERVPLSEIKSSNNFGAEDNNRRKRQTNECSYQYYYDFQTISNFKNSAQKSLSNFDIHLKSRDFYLGLNKIKPLSNRSQISKATLKNQPLSGEQIKNRISILLDGKYQSQSLTRIMASLIKETYEKTKILGKSLQLISANTETLDFQAYLNLFNFQSLTTIKLINVRLSDHQFKILIEFIWNKKIEILVLTGNKLTENCLNMIMNRSFLFLKQIYLGKNRISRYRAKQNLVELRSKFMVYL